MPEYFTTTEVAKMLKVSIDTIYNWIDTGYLPARYVYKFKRRYRFSIEILKWKPGVNQASK